MPNKSLEPTPVTIARFVSVSSGAAQLKRWASGAAQCWLDANMARIIPGTTDALCSRDHEEFQIEARQFAEAFNAQVFRESSKFQTHTCGAQQALAADARKSSRD